LEAIPEAVERGVTSFKVFTVYDQGISHGFIDEVAQAVGAVDGVLAAHTEDGSVCDRRTNELIEAGRGAMSEQPASRPPRSESMEAAAVGRLACEAGCRYYGVHTTARGAVRALEALQNEFGPEQVRAETCIQYATLDESAMADLGELGITTPPLRPSDHREAVFDAVVDGGLDIVSTDHVGITAAEKAGEQWWDVQSGITGLSTSFPVFYDEAVVRRGYDPSLVVDVMSATPARLFGMPEKGSLAIGTDADIVVVDPDAETVVRGEDEAGRADYSVYEGRKLGLGVEQTFVRGTLVAESGTVVGEPGHGQFVGRSVPDWTPNRDTGVEDA
jgi:dihydropyrimidinase